MKIRDSWYQNHCQKIHKQKLLAIKQQTSNRIDNFLPQSIIVANRRLNEIKHKRSLDLQVFAKENQTILDRIIGIIGRPSNKLSVTKSTPKFQYEKFQPKNKKNDVKTSSAYRKVKNSFSPTFSSKQLEKEYEKVLKIKKNISKKHEVFCLDNQKDSKLPLIKHTQSINIIKSDSPDNLDFPIPPYKDTSDNVTPLQESYIKIISHESQNHSNHDSNSNADDSLI